MKKGLIAVLATIAGTAVGTVITGKVVQNTLHGTQQMSDKHLALFLMMNRWVEVKQDGKSLFAYFHDKEYKSIAIYGMSYAGERLLHELKNSGIEVKYGIDQKADEIYTDVDILTINDELPNVDAIVVTSIYFFNEISEKLKALTDIPVISLEDILYEI